MEKHVRPRKVKAELTKAYNFHGRNELGVPTVLHAGRPRFES